LGTSSFTQRRENSAKAVAEKALEVDPARAEAHFSLAQIIELYDWNWSEAEKEYRLALQLNPNYAFAHLEYGRFLQAMGRNDEAMTHVNYALELDPFDFKTKDFRAWVIWASRQYDLAIEQFEELGDYAGLAWTYREKKMYPEAIVAQERSVTRSRRHSLALASLASVYGLAGKKVEALKLIAELKDRARQHYVSGVLLADAYVGLGEKDQALTWLERAYEDRDQWMVYIKADPRQDPLRPEPRFQTLLRRMNFPP
jgi:tetratricopeptide (TPR) repeat protein